MCSIMASWFSLVQGGLTFFNHSRWANALEASSWWLCPPTTVTLFACIYTNYKSRATTIHTDILHIEHKQVRHLSLSHNFHALLTHMYLQVHTIMSSCFSVFLTHTGTHTTEESSGVDGADSFPSLCWVQRRRSPTSKPNVVIGKKIHWPSAHLGKRASSSACVLLLLAGQAAQEQEEPPISRALQPASIDSVQVE